MPLICQQIELDPRDWQLPVLASNAIAARVGHDDLIMAWRANGERMRKPAVFARKLLRRPGPRQIREVPDLRHIEPVIAEGLSRPGLVSVKNMLAPESEVKYASDRGPLQWSRYGLGDYRPLLNAEKYHWHPWFSQVSQNAVKGGYRDAEDAIRRFYSGQNRRPRLHGRRRRLAFRADNGVGTVRISGRYLILPEKAGGAIKLKEPLRWPGKEIRECRVWEKAGRWQVSVRVCISPEEYAQRCGVGTIGLDLGLHTFVAIARPGDTQDTVEKREAPKPLERSLASLRRAHRKVSRRKAGSKNREKAVRSLARRQRRMESIRKDFLHKLFHELTAEAETVQVESLSIKGWQKRWGRKTSDLAPGEFLRQLEYKAGWRGGGLVKAEWHFPSTQLCHGCGWQSGKLNLSVRQWRCGGCGRENDRDANAALNIRDYQPGAVG